MARTYPGCRARRTIRGKLIADSCTSTSIPGSLEDESFANNQKKGLAPQFSLGKRRQQDYPLQLAARRVCVVSPLRGAESTIQINSFGLKMTSCCDRAGNPVSGLQRRTSLNFDFWRMCFMEAVQFGRNCPPRRFLRSICRNCWVSPLQQCFAVCSNASQGKELQSKRGIANGLGQLQRRPILQRIQISVDRGGLCG